MISQIDQTIYRLNNLDKLQEKLNFQHGGKKLQHGSDDSVLFGRITSAEGKIRTYEGIKTQIERTQVQNNTADAAMGSMIEALRTVKSELMKANTSTTNDENLKAIAVNINGIRENLFTLVNTNTEGEYVFAGSDSSIKPFVKDANGNITYEGDNRLRKVAVEEGSYRERGVNGFDVMFFTSSSATKGDVLSFSANDRILDQNGNEWVLNSPTNDTLTKMNKDGTATTETLAVTAPVAPDTNYSVTLPNTDGTSFEAKTNIFDLLQDIVNTLNMKDENGNAITRDEVMQKLSTQIENIDKSFDSVNISHADLGAKNKVFENSLDLMTSKITQYKILETNLSSSDYTELALQAKSLELTYAAMYSTVMRTQELSLVNYMK